MLCSQLQATPLDGASCHVSLLPEEGCGMKSDFLTKPQAISLWKLFSFRTLVSFVLYKSDYLLLPRTD